MRFRPLALAAGILTLATAGLAVAQQWESSGILAYRQSEMKVLGAHMGAIKAVVTDQRDFLASVPRHAEDIAAVAKLIPSLFPEGSGAGTPAGDTDALPAIWEKWGDFQAQAQTMGKLAEELAATAETGDPMATAQAFAKLGKEGCGACHETFRKKSS
ncbi:c-type cytochrome [Marinimicrococcus flavescens]|uniref:Cytochrome c n=1 Tax=Marinimicrococcus flavescens TaxID=3031815 RepID=A0AAP4D4X1_9PROT|nr:cytochrome c [Marinimicrococcus flavescens]